MFQMENNEIGTANEIYDIYVNNQSIRISIDDVRTSKRFYINKNSFLERLRIESSTTCCGILAPGEKLAEKVLGCTTLLSLMLLFFTISVVGCFLMWFTEYYNNAIISNLVLSNDSEALKNWMDPSPKYDTLLRVHIFNYTNIDRYLSGADEKIKVEDIGPLTYKEHTMKACVSLNKNYTITYRDHRSYTFLAEKSSIREDAKVIIPNVPLLTASAKINEMNPFKKFAASTLIQSFNEDLFKKLKAHEFLWGYNDRIVSLDFGTGKTRFGLLMNRNGTSVDSLQIYTGEDEIEKLGIITQFNGLPAMDFWNDHHCNRIDGTDGSMFSPTTVKTRENLHVFLQVLCRKVALYFEKEVKLFNNIQALRYRTPLNVFAHPKFNQENRCYCQNTNKCLPSGVINATKCYNGAPIFPSFPHFFSGNATIYKDFEGIRPNASLHQTYADIHPRFAFPISGASRIQINIMVQRGSVIEGKLGRMQEGIILPLLWIEITSGDFTEEIIDKLYISTFGLDAIQNVLKYGTLFMCITSLILTFIGFSYINRRREEKEIHIDAEFKTSSAVTTF